MPKLPLIFGKTAIKTFEKIGYVFDRQKGSHIVLRHIDSPHRRLTIPNHTVLSKGTLRAILRESGLSIEEFIEIL
ncbi:MAG: type II toxin-antitoxin system HicA family toxin [Candidatus Omnitrophota bacterium]